MEEAQFVLPQPRFEDLHELRIAGLTGRYTQQQTGEIPAQWDRFNVQLGSGLVPGRRGADTYGVVFAEDVMRYVTGIDMEPDAVLPLGWEAVSVPAQHYAVFVDRGGVPVIRKVWAAIFTEWFLASARKIANGPMLERYAEQWAEDGSFEILIPLQV